MPDLHIFLLDVFSVNVFTFWCTLFCPFETCFNSIMAAMLWCLCMKLSNLVLGHVCLSCFYSLIRKVLKLARIVSHFHISCLLNQTKVSCSNIHCPKPQCVPFALFSSVNKRVLEQPVWYWFKGGRQLWCAAILLWCLESLPIPLGSKWGRKINW